MKALVVYDSRYGNTERVALAVAESGAPALHFADAAASKVAGVDLLVVGSPTQGGRPTAALNDWLYRLPDGSLRGKDAAAFDTRFAPADRVLGSGS